MCVNQKVYDIHVFVQSDGCTARGLKARQRHGLLVEVGAQVEVVVAVVVGKCKPW